MTNKQASSGGKMKLWIGGALAIVLLLLLAVNQFGPEYLEKSVNQIVPAQLPTVSDEADKLHDSLIIGDWHSDSTLWDRDLTEKSDYGHMDVPRLQAGNVAIQMFTSVTKSPAGQNYESNETSAEDRITSLVVMQAWPIKTWSSLTERAIYQSERLKGFAEKSPDDLKLVLTKADLTAVLAKRTGGSKQVAALLGTEGSHALDGDLKNVQRLYDHGFRMMSLQHFFDNKLGGSLHGTSGEGLSEFGRAAVKKINELQIILDVSHSAEQVVKDTLALSTRPLVVSHTGFKGHCDSARNIPDDLMKAIAAKGGLIGVGYWDGAMCEISPKNIVAAMRYGIDLVGVEHVALGSDYDGSTEVQFDTSKLAVLTQEMINAEFTESEIRAVMGENMLRFLQENLPQD